MWLPIIRAATEGRPYISEKSLTEFKDFTTEYYR
jgi:hypothetical protein